MPETPLLDRIHVPADLKTFGKDQLPQIAAELRAETIDAASVTGGHFGAGLGVIELTVALHYVFDTPKDRLVWDVGHQAYPHKILTGRRARIRSIRKPGGLSGFTRRSESAFDPFGAAHSSTSISAALGMAVARDLNGGANHVIAVIGDGAMSAGMAYEALNNAGALKNRLIIVLNDNAMSIAPPVGALDKHLRNLVSKADADASLFTNLGFRYVGPVDGHDVVKLASLFEDLRDGPPGPVLVHAVTEKGRGYAPAEQSADKGHATAKFDVATGVQAKSTPGAPTYTSVFAKALIAEAEHDKRIVAITAAMPSGTGVDAFEKRFPQRSFDTGIAEQHAVTFAAGLATEGIKPFCAIYSTFLQRGYDQLVHDVVLQNLPVRFVLDRAGLVGADGATHAGSFDLAYLTCLPNMVVMAPADEAELMNMVATQAAYDEGPSAIRFPRGEGAGVALPARGQVLAIGKGRMMREGSDAAILSLGTRLGASLAAADMLAAQGLSISVADARFAKPLDIDLIRRLVRHHRLLVTLEEGAAGGFGAQVLTFLANEGLLRPGLEVRTLTLPDIFQDHDDPARQYEAAGLSAPDIAGLIRDQSGGKSRDLCLTLLMVARPEAGAPGRFFRQNLPEWRSNIPPRTFKPKRAGYFDEAFAMNRILPRIALAFVVLAGVLSLPARAQAPDPAAATVQSFYDGLTASMKAGGTVKSRYDRLKPVMDQTFDLAGMTALSVGTSWTTLSEADQKALVESFSRFTIATYARNFDSFHGEKFTVDPAVNQRGSDKYVKSDMKSASGDAIAFNYRLHEAGGGWKVIDIYLAGNISQLAQRRADFAATLSAGGAQGLAKKINALADQMG